MVRLARADTDEVTTAIVGALVPLVRPELILLFGSRASGEPHDDSDWDIMLVLPDAADVEPDRGRAHHALSALGISADVLARTATTYRRCQHDAGYLDWLVSREGRVLYASGALAQREQAPRVREPAPPGFALWLERSDADLREATISAEASSPVPDAICFHAHACIEKRLKALIAKAGTFPPRTHDLMELLPLVRAQLRENDAVVRGCERLQKLYPASRYPELAMPTLEDARQALGIARQLRDVIQV